MPIHCARAFVAAVLLTCAMTHAGVPTVDTLQKTDHILFIAAGAFHSSKPSDLMPELQGRFPIRVELQDLTKDDFLHR